MQEQLGHEPQLLKPAYLEPVLCNKRSHYSEKLTHLKAEEPRLTQPGKAHARQCRPSTAKNKNKWVNKNFKNEAKDVAGNAFGGHI